MSAFVTGDKEIDRVLAGIQSGAVQKIMRPAISAGLRVATKAMKAAVPANMKDAKKAIGSRFNKSQRNGELMAKAGAGVGMKANRMPGPLKPVQAFAKGGKVGKLVQFYAKGGPVKAACMAKGGKAKSGGKKVIMGTAKEAADVMNALKSVKKPMTPPPGLATASPMMNPRMGAPRKKGGTVRKKMAAGGAARVRLHEPTPKPIKKVPYINGD